jgi:hypothetical protein
MMVVTQAFEVGLVVGAGLLVPGSDERNDVVDFQIASWCVTFGSGTPVFGAAPGHRAGEPPHMMALERAPARV